MTNSQDNKEKKFLHNPEYPGGKNALFKYIADNLRYPDDALENNIEGIVGVAYEVDNEGIVTQATVRQSLSPSCDKEALRLVKSLRYSRPKNIKLRVKSKFNINIIFKIKPGPSIVYTEVPSAPKDEKKSTGNTNSYTIEF